MRLIQARRPRAGRLAVVTTLAAALVVPGAVPAFADPLAAAATATWDGRTVPLREIALTDEQMVNAAFIGVASHFTTASFASSCLNGTNLDVYVLASDPDHAIATNRMHGVSCVSVTYLIETAGALAGWADISYEPAFESDLPIGPATMSSLTFRDNVGPSDDSDGDGGDGLAPGGGGGTPDVYAGDVMRTALGDEQHQPSWACTVYASDPRKTIRNGKQSIEGDGWQSCWGVGWELARLQLRVQQYRGLGHWATKYSWDSGWVLDSFIDRVLWWYCASGTGYQKYRIVATGQARNGQRSQSVQSANYLKVRCPA